MSRFKRQMERGGLSNFERKNTPSSKKKQKIDITNLKRYASLSWVVLTPMNVLKMFLAYMVVALCIETPLTKSWGSINATVFSHGLITSLLIVLLLNGANGKKANVKELCVRYIVMAIIFGLGTMITSTYLFK